MCARTVVQQWLTRKAGNAWWIPCAIPLAICVGVGVHSRAEWWPRPVVSISDFSQVYKSISPEIGPKDSPSAGGAHSPAVAPTWRPVPMTGRPTRNLYSVRVKFRDRACAPTPYTPLLYK